MKICIVGQGYIGLPTAALFAKNGCEVLGVDVNEEIVDKLNEQQNTITELKSIINHIKCEEDCFDYDYCCETVCSLYNEIKHLKEENEQLKNKLNNDL